MLYGTTEKFTYFQCRNCKCLQIAQIPGDLSRYYRGSYYSLTVSPGKKYRNPLVGILRKIQDSGTVLNSGFWSSLIKKIVPNKKLLSLAPIGLQLDDRIIDVGCGTGWLLYALREIGFSNLLGIDLFLEHDIHYDNGLTVKRATLRELSGTWDLIMYHHAFEHVSDPLAELKGIARLLATGGHCLLRIPIVSSYAWEHYRERWVGLEAPRHLYLHSVESIRHLADAAGFIIQDIIFDSTDYQFRGSELYVRGITQCDASGNISQTPAGVSRSQLRTWKRRAKQLNREQRGDQAAFLLKKQPETEK